MSIKIHFINGDSELVEKHYLQKEYRNDIIFECGGFYYEVYFFTEKALEYEILTDGYFSMPGIIILTEVSNSKIILAIKELFKVGYFKYFIGKEKIPINTRFIQQWYDNDMATFNTKSMSSLDLEV